MKTTMPHHPEPFSDRRWTKLEEEAIRAAMVAAYNEAIGSAIDACLDMQAGWVPDVATECADAIRKLKEQA